MKHVLIGTAGHVDHGKTALIRALTGFETDRLKEEKKRGITIDLGFAYMELPGGQRVGIVDVPGHEKFIKNMLAGAGGIDLVLLVIAADDGVMPQTREHLGILQLLNAKDGIVVLTKSDLVDEDWLEMIKDDVCAFAADTFLKNAPLICVSSHTGASIDELKTIIAQKIAETGAKNTKTPFRIPVDRVFSSEGFGTVITGTLVEGTLNQGESVEINPTNNSGKRYARVRTLQVHGGQVEKAFAGQRVAVNLSGITRDEITRGDILAFPESMQCTRMLDVKISVLKDSPREIKNNSRLHFYYGTRNVLCKAVLMDADKLLPGESGYAQLRFVTEVAVKRGDSFVLRFYSPTETVGGGAVLNENPKKYRRIKTAETLKSLEGLEQGGIGENIRQAIEDAKIANLGEMQKRFALPPAEWENELQFLLTDGEIHLPTPQTVITETYRAELLHKLEALLTDFHKENPLQPGKRKEELRNKLLPDQKPAFFDALLQLYNNEVKTHEGRVSLALFKITYTKEQAKIRDDILSRLQNAPFTPPSQDELLAPYQKNAKKMALQIWDAMQTEGVIIQTEPSIVFASEAVKNAKSLFTDLAEQNPSGVTLARFRDATGTSRKFALSMLEYFDRVSFTRKIGDVRVIP